MSKELPSPGSAVTAPPTARQLREPPQKAASVNHDSCEPCANCGIIRRGPYCHECGQFGHVHRTAGALVHDIAHGVFHFEGKIWRTLPLLAFRPGELTRRYVDGERAKFVSPMALFLFSVFLMFAVVSGLAGPVQVQSPRESAAAIATERAALAAQIAALEAQERTTAPAAARQALAGRLEEVRARLGALAAVERGLGLAQPGSAGASASGRLDIHSGWHWLDEAVGRAADNPALLLYKMKSYGYKYSWVLIPLSLPFLWLLFAFRRDVGFYDHAIFATYSLSFMSLGIVALTLFGWLGVSTILILPVALLVPPVHIFTQLKGAYGLTRRGAAWRTVALLLIVTVTSVLYVGLLFYLGSE